MATVGELITSLGFTIDQSQLRRYQNISKEAVRRATAAGAAISAALFSNFIKVTASTFGDFERQLNETQAVLGVTKNAMADLENQAQKLGSTTKFSASQAAQAQTEFARAGFQTKEIIAALPATLNLAAAANLNMAQAAEISGGVLRGFGLEASQTTRVTDVLAKTASTAALTVSDLQESFKFLSGPANAAGQSLEDISTLLGIAANNSIKGTLAGTGFSEALTRLTTKKTQAELKNLGVEVQDQAGNMRPLIDIIGDVSAATANMANIQKLSTVNNIFGQTAQKSILAVMNTAPAVIEKQRKSINNATGAAGKMAAVMNQGLNAAITQLKSATEGAFIAMGREFAPVIIKIAKFITNVVSAFNQLNPNIKKFIAFLTLAGTAIGGYLATVLTIGPALTKLGSLLLGVQLKALAVPLAIGALLAGVALIVQDIITYIQGGESVLGDLVNQFPLLKKVVQEIGRFFNENKQAIKEFGFFIVEVAKEAIEGFKNFGFIIDIVKNIFAGLLTGFLAGGLLIANLVKLGFQGFGLLIDVIKNLREILVNLFTQPLEFLNGFFDAFVFGIDTVKSALQGLINVFQNIFNVVGDIVGSGADLLSGLFGGSGVGDFFNNAKNSLKSFLDTPANKIINLQAAGNIPGPGQFLPQADPSISPVNTGTGGGVNQTNQTSLNGTVINNNVTVATNAAPTEIAAANSSATNESLRSVLASTQRNFPRVLR